MRLANFLLSLNDVSTGDSKKTIRFVLLIASIWIVVGLLLMTSIIPASGRAVLTVVALLASVMLALYFFNLI